MDINENILQAIQIVAESEVNKVSFDKTVICEIIDDVNHEKGQYLVEENGARFFAYSESTRYRKKQQVYVLIPGGNYDNIQKTIISRYSAEASEKPITYIPPFEQLVILYQNNLVPPIKEMGLRANDEITIEKECVSFDTPEFDSRFCTTLGLKCDFRCLLQNYNIESGEYGLSFELYNEKYDQSLENGFSSKVKKRTLKFSSQDILGNPFGFTSYVPQEVKLNIQTIDYPIKHIKIKFYQDNKFKEYGQEQLLPKNNFNDYDIFVRNIELYYSNDVSLIKNETFRIYTDNLLYQMDGENNFKTVISKWYNVDKNNRYIGFEDADNYEIEWQHSVDGEWKAYAPPSFDQVKTITLSKNSKREYVKAILYKGKERVSYESNILTFENVDISEDPLAVDQIAALKIKLGNNSKYSYPLYNIDNTLDNPAQAYLERALEIEVQCLSLNITQEKFLKEASFEWKIPTVGTMLSYNESYLTEGAEGEKFSKGTIEEKTNLISFKSDKYIPFCYQIKPIYSRNFIHNDIICIATHNDIEYKAQIHFDFSSFGMNNSSYYLAIVPRVDEQKPGFVKRKTFKLEALLFDADQQQVDLSKDEHKKYITWTLPNGQIIKGNNYLDVESYDENNINIYKVEVNIMDSKKQAFVNLSCQYGLPLSKKDTYCGITPTQVIYDSAGVNPKYYRDEFILFDISTGLDIPVNWDIKYYQDKNLPIEYNYLPKLNNNKNRLLAQRLYIHGLKTKISLIAKQGNELLWEQPIILGQNTHSSKVLNEWDGSLQINKEKNYALSAMFGAGRKNPNGDTFDGVLMGDLTRAEGDNNNIGLYGYNNGVQSFGFNIEGKAFLGKTGKGQINFDGDLGVIESGTYSSSKGTEGMKIDLSSGHIDAFNFMLSAGNLLLNSNPEEKDYYFKVGKDNNMISLSAKGELDIHSNKFTLEAKDPNNTDNYLGLFSEDQKNSIEINNSGKKTDWRIVAGKSFGVTKSGNLYGSNVSLKGNIEADSGRIGNWTIKDGYLKGVNKENHTYIAPPGIRGNYIFSAGIGEDQSKHPFYILSNGYIHSTSGDIGGWFIGDDQLFAKNSKDLYTYISAPRETDQEGYVFAAGGGIELNKHPFYIKQDGFMKATSADITGKINATSGKIGNWEINEYLKGSGFLLDEKGNPTNKECFTYVSPPGIQGMGNHVFTAGGGADLKSHPFRVLSDGSLFAKRGQIGGWVLSDNKLYAEGKKDSLYLSPNTGTVINVGGSNASFVVNSDGTMKATNAVIDGTITAKEFWMNDHKLTFQTISHTDWHFSTGQSSRYLIGDFSPDIAGGVTIGTVTIPGQTITVPVFGGIGAEIPGGTYDVITNYVPNFIGGIQKITLSSTPHSSKCIGYEE